LQKSFELSSQTVALFCSVLTCLVVIRSVMWRRYLYQWPVHLHSSRKEIATTLLSEQ